MRVVKPESGRIEKTPIGNIVLHGCESVGMKPLNKHEKRLAGSKQYKDWPIERVERFICMDRVRLGVDELDEKQVGGLG